MSVNVEHQHVELVPLAQRASSARTDREREGGRRLQVAKESGLENRVLVAGAVILFCVKVTVG